MKKHLILITPFFLALTYSCKKEIVEAADQNTNNHESLINELVPCENEVVLEEDTVEIHPYLAVYPGSYWHYKDSVGNPAFSRIVESNYDYQKIHVTDSVEGSCELHFTQYKYVPKLSNGLIINGHLGYFENNVNELGALTNGIILIDTIVDNEWDHKTHYYSSYGEYSITRTKKIVFDKLDQFTADNVTYSDVIVIADVREFESSMGDFTDMTKYFYARNIGLFYIEKNRINGFYEEIFLDNYHINN